MTTSLQSARLGSQAPRVSTAPPSEWSRGDEAIAIAAECGLFLDPWQQAVMRGGLGETGNRWSAFEVAVVVSRQNGKGSILEAREIAGLFHFGERLILHSAHEFKTASEAFRRVLSLVENTDNLRKRVAKVRTSHGDEGIELLNGNRLRFVARSRGSGRGFTGDCIILDEAYNLPAEAMAALLPTLSARPNPQLWYASSAGMDTSEQLRSVRARGHKGGSSLAYFEWSAAEDADPDDREAWAQANPALGIRISEEFVAREHDAMPPAEFARERLGIWDDPTSSMLIVPPGAWASCLNGRSTIVGPPTFAVSVSPDRTVQVIGAVGRNQAGRLHLEVVEQRRGTTSTWVAPTVARLMQHGPRAVVVDPNSAAGALIPDLEQAGVELRTVNGPELQQAAGAIFDAVVAGEVAHLGQRPLDDAVAAATLKPAARGGSRWHPMSTVQITALEAVTAAAFLVLDAPTYDVLQSAW